VDPRVAIGRASELLELERFLASATARALVLCGERGIGKSTLWEEGVDLARSRGVATLCARASEAESQLSFAGLADLVEAIDSTVRAEVPAPQRHALEVAVGHAEPGDRQPDAYAVSAALLSALRVLSSRERVLVAVDDLSRLDPASGEALVFATRRLADRDVRYLLSRPSGPPSELERVLEPGGVDTLAVGPLSFGAINHLLAARLGRSLPRRVLRQLYEMSAGNPLLALELGRAVLEHGPPEIGATLPVPTGLDELFGERVASLEPDVGRALLAVALNTGLRGDELAAVVDPLVIEDARTSGVLSFDGTRMRASHPLLAAAAAERSTARERREVHQALAGAMSDSEPRARHRAMAASAPDVELADEVAAAAARAAARGAVQDAAELATQALRLTPRGDDEYDRRLVALARYLIGAGEHVRATDLLSERLEAMAPGAARAAAHLLLGEAAEVAVEEEHLAHAIAESTGDPGLRAQALAKQAELLAINYVRRIVEAEELAREALAAARAAAPESERRALVALGWARILRGYGIDHLVERSTRLGPAMLSLLECSLERPAGVRLAFRGEPVKAREVFRRLVAVADERGDFRSGMALTVQLCEVELRAGRSSEAARSLEEWGEWNGSDLAEASGVRTRARAALAALRGEPRRAATLAAEVLEAGDANAAGWDRLEALRVLGVAALLEREPERAIESLGKVWEHTQREGVDDPGAFPVAGDLVEALAETGRLDTANEVIERLAGLAVAQRHPWGLATVKRSAAVVELLRGWDEAAADALAQAATEYRALGLEFDCARALLFLGRVARRFKKRATARRSLEEARSAFEQLDCPGWAQAATEELSRVSGRRPAADGGLTPSEQRVAALVAGGLSNKEVAAQLFVSVYTVEEHLSHVYAKLGIRSRTQLAGRLSASA
jgi:DNA-binding CsgD family transcriptional regulator